MWHVGVKETYLDVCGSWIAFSSQLSKWCWFHDGLAVSRETQGGVVKLLGIVFENCFSCRCRGGGVSRETLFLNLIQLLGNVVQRLKALTCMTTFWE